MKERVKKKRWEKQQVFGGEQTDNLNFECVYFAKKTNKRKISLVPDFPLLHFSHSLLLLCPPNFLHLSSISLHLHSTMTADFHEHVPFKALTIAGSDSGGYETYTLTYARAHLPRSQTTPLSLFPLLRFRTKNNKRPIQARYCTVHVVLMHLHIYH